MKKITESWPAMAIRARDEGKQYRVVNGNKLREHMLAGTDVKASEYAIHRATAALIFVRRTNASVYAVSLVDGRAYYSHGSGYGLDLVAYVCSGLPYAPGLYLRDHSEGDEAQVHRPGRLPSPYFVI